MDRAPIFTAPEAWIGGFYELTFLYPLGFDMSEALAAVWEFPGFVEGPVESRSTEPWKQPSASVVEIVDGYYQPRWGVMELEPGELVACGVMGFELRHTAQVEVGIPHGSLDIARPGVEPWGHELEPLFRALGRHLYERAPFRRAQLDHEGHVVDEADLGPVPEDRGLGILEPVGGELTWFPPV